MVNVKFHRANYWIPCIFPIDLLRDVWDKGRKARASDDRQIIMTLVVESCLSLSKIFTYTLANL